MRLRSFSHVGITVSDFDRAVRFYATVFGCPLITVKQVPPERVRAFFGVEGPNPSCRVGLIRIPGGALLEMFAFDSPDPLPPLRWNRVGVTHVAFNVRNLSAWHARLAGGGVECVSAPVTLPNGVSFFYAKDPDGNLIELVDPGWRNVLRNRVAGLVTRFRGRNPNRQA